MLKVREKSVALTQGPDAKGPAASYALSGCTSPWTGRRSNKDSEKHNMPTQHSNEECMPRGPCPASPPLTVLDKFALSVRPELSVARWIVEFVEHCQVHVSRGNSDPQDPNHSTRCTMVAKRANACTGEDRKVEHPP